MRDALKKIAKPDRGPSPHGWRVWFFTSSSGKVKASGWKGPAKVVLVADRQATLEYRGQMLKRSIDMLKFYYDPHEFAGSVKPKWLESVADSLHRLFREALDALHASKTVAESTRFQLEQHFGMRLLRGKMATDPCRFQGLRGIPFSQIGKRATVLFDKSDSVLWFHEDLGAP